MIDAAQCRAARGLVDWSLERLAEQVGLSIEELFRFEHGGISIRPPPMRSSASWKMREPYSCQSEAAAARAYVSSLLGRA